MNPLNYVLDRLLTMNKSKRYSIHNRRNRERASTKIDTVNQSIPFDSTRLGYNQLVPSNDVCFGFGCDSVGFGYGCSQLGTGFGFGCNLDGYGSGYNSDGCGSVGFGCNLETVLAVTIGDISIGNYCVVL